MSCINKNIMKIIMDKKELNEALNEWKNKVKKINEEYHYYFEWNDEIELRYWFGSCGHNTVYSYRMNSRYQDIHNSLINKCSQCGTNHPVASQNKVGTISKNHYYSSGMNDPNGYKKIE